MIIYNPYDWYWLADDGRLYSSKKQNEIENSDPDYVAWTGDGAQPTVWPRDEDGNQTDAELQRLLFPYRLAVDLKSYAYMARDQKEHDGCPISGVGPVSETRTDAYTQSLISRYADAAATNPAFTVAWVLPDRSTTMLDKTAIDSLSAQLTAFIVGTYTTYSEVVAGIDGGTITTTEQIDQAFSGVPVRKGEPRVDIGWKT